MFNFDGDEFVEEYQSQLMLLEFNIVLAYRQDDTLLDLEVENVLNQFIRFYEAQEKGREISFNVSDKLLPFYQTLQYLNDMFMNGVSAEKIGPDSDMTSEDIEAINKGPRLSPAELIACYKHLRRSLRYWNKKGGRRGYFDYIKQFSPL